MFSVKVFGPVFKLPPWHAWQVNSVPPAVVGAPVLEATAPPELPTLHSVELNMSTRTRRKAEISLNVFIIF